MNLQQNKERKNWLSLLPLNIRKLLTSLELSDVLVDINTKYKLTEEPKTYGEAKESKGAKLIKIVVEVLKGELSPKSFSKILQEKLGTDAKTTKKIAEAIKQKVFSKVEEGLSELYATEKKPSALKQFIETPTSSEKTTIPEKIDTYREPIE